MNTVSIEKIYFFGLVIMVFIYCGLLSTTNVIASDDWQAEFNIMNRKLIDSGASTYFNLEPGFQIVLESEDEKVTITVLNETVATNGMIMRVVEEMEEEAGELVEISRNLFAMDMETGDVFYFGEEVDIYEAGELKSHAGAWMAFKDGAEPGLMMPGTPAVGMKYYQELAPGVAMDRAEIISITETLETPAGTFKNCLKVEETSKIKPEEKDYKIYAPGIGMVQDEDLKCTSYGHLKSDCEQNQ